MAAARIPRAERGHVRVGDRAPESVDTAIRQLVLTPKSCNCSLLTSPEQGTTTLLCNVGHNGLGNFCAARANTRSARNEGVATSGRKYASVIGDARAYRGIPQWNKVHCSHRLGSNVVTSKNQIAHRVPLFHVLGRSELSTLLKNSVRPFATTIPKSQTNCKYGVATIGEGGEQLRRYCDWRRHFGHQFWVPIARAKSTSQLLHPRGTT